MCERLYYWESEIIYDLLKKCDETFSSNESVGKRQQLSENISILKECLLKLGIVFTDRSILVTKLKQTNYTVHVHRGRRFKEFSRTRIRAYISNIKKITNNSIMFQFKFKQNFYYFEYKFLKIRFPQDSNPERSHPVRS